MSVAVCAAFECLNCRHFLSKECRGCEEENKALMEEEGTLCAVFACAREQGLETCEDCLRVPCPFVQRGNEICPIRLRFEPSIELELSLEVLTRRLVSKVEGALMPVARIDKLPQKSVLRASQYIACLEQLLRRGKDFVSSFELAQETGVKPTLVRKDLSYFGEFGSREGYRTRYLLSQLTSVLKLDVDKLSAWVGAERLKGDMELLERLGYCGFRVAAVFDPDPSLAGTTVATFQVQPLDSLPVAVEQFHLSTGVIAVPTLTAQACAEALLSAGINYLLNLSATWIVAPPPAVVRNCNLLGELFILSYEHRPRPTQPSPPSAFSLSPRPARSIPT